MGMFDSVFVLCPECGESTEFQSKAGERTLDNFTLDSAPAVILLDIAHDEGRCGNGHVFHLKVQTICHASTVRGPIRKGDDDDL